MFKDILHEQYKVLIPPNNIGYNSHVLHMSGLLYTVLKFHNLVDDYKSIPLTNRPSKEQLMSIKFARNVSFVINSILDSVNKFHIASTIPMYIDLRAVEFVCDLTGLECNVKDDYWIIYGWAD